MTHYETTLNGNLLVLSFILAYLSTNGQNTNTLVTHLSQSVVQSRQNEEEEDHQYGGMSILRWSSDGGHP